VRGKKTHRRGNARARARPARGEPSKRDGTLRMSAVHALPCMPPELREDGVRSNVRSGTSPFCWASVRKWDRENNHKSVEVENHRGRRQVHRPSPGYTASSARFAISGRRKPVLCVVEKNCLTPGF